MYFLAVINKYMEMQQLQHQRQKTINETQYEVYR